jgi:hypothetical protein
MTQEDRSESKPYQHQIAQHTPGPWVTHKDEIVAEHGASICRMSDTPRTIGEDDANAKLITAAPQLLHVLKLISHSMEQASIPGNDYKRELKLSYSLAEQAIEKTELIK